MKERTGITNLWVEAINLSKWLYISYTLVMRLKNGCIHTWKKAHSQNEKQCHDEREWMCETKILSLIKYKKASKIVNNELVEASSSHDIVCVCVYFFLKRKWTLSHTASNAWEKKREFTLKHCKIGDSILDNFVLTKSEEEPCRIKLNMLLPL